jgi:hypothetical protein
MLGCLNDVLGSVLIDSVWMTSKFLMHSDYGQSNVIRIHIDDRVAVMSKSMCLKLALYIMLDR